MRVAKELYQIKIGKDQEHTSGIGGVVHAVPVKDCLCLLSKPIRKGFRKVGFSIISSCPLSAFFSLKIFGDFFCKLIKYGKRLLVGVYRKCQQRQLSIRKSQSSRDIIDEAKT